MQSGRREGCSDEIGGEKRKREKGPFFITIPKKRTRNLRKGKRRKRRNLDF